MKADRGDFILGIDIGSVSVSIVCIDRQGIPVSHAYSLHRGNIRDTVKGMMADVNDRGIAGIAAPSGKTAFRDHVRTYDVQVSLMEAVGAQGIPVRSILHVGAERFFLVEMDDQGHYLQTCHSSSCAAGTGSFLDQQALRLNLENTAQLSDLALQNRDAVPDIAARCSVFAKTDLIHAQQKGYGLEAICDSLCKGLADNISDTLFNKAFPAAPVVMTGGVSRNRSVVGHLERIIGQKIGIHPLSHLFPALGAALLLLKELPDGRKPDRKGLPDLKEPVADPGEREYFYAPLRSVGPEPGDVKITGRYIHHPGIAGHTSGVQVDVFVDAATGDPSYYLGIDVGSTSTKAVLLGTEGKPLAGFYTYTGGQPLKATRALLEAAEQFALKCGVEFHIVGCGTTGSGRKFIGGIVGADLVVDEITAHARAAFELNPLTDTIIEIGGQDSKFTQMKDGMVTFSHMNTVCAAGTGSFIEELAGRLGVGLDDFEGMALGREAPLASDRCTVFMERDINQLLSRGYRVEEVLATVIHSVRENYLKKVASEAHIGDHICFQGATARNRALVAAFEQRLGKPLFVSALCHLTGALGTALLLKEEFTGRTAFRGLSLHRREIPVRTETCGICLNRCTITLVSINGEQQTYGFLCGRDYETKKYVKQERGAFELLRERKRLADSFRPHQVRKTPAIGIPASLHLHEDLDYWKAFFGELGIPVITSEDFRDSLKTGKKIAGAEFCAPIDSMYGHVAHLSGKCDFIFMPVYLESRSRPVGTEQNFCYYTQFSASLAYLEGDHMQEKMVSPMLNFRKNADHNVKLLAESLGKMGIGGIAPASVREAMRRADRHSRQLGLQLTSLYLSGFKTEGEVQVVLLGRPYVVLSGTLNKGIPDIFARMGINAWYQDMLPVEEGGDEAFRKLPEKIPWHFAADILRAAEFAGRTRNLYPVLVTAFKCAPDSFIMEYFKQVMHLYGKPYLIIQIDEHDSNTGYETRIEAALRAFRNHAGKAVSVAEPDLGSILPRVDTSVNGKILLMPNWDTFVSPLVAANLRRSGIDTRVLETTGLTIRKSMVHNTGQCLPINIIAQDYIDYIEKHGLDPSRVILWMMEGKMSCNLRQYPYYIKRILENYGNGMEKASVYTGEITHREMSIGVTYYAYFAYMLGGLFRKTACRIRPYETVPGTTDRVFQQVQEILVQALSGAISIEQGIRDGMALIDTIDYDRHARKPLVAIFGDLYVRDNDILNQELVKDIEAAGGEALVTPYHDYTKIVIENIFRRASQRGEHVETSMNRILLNVLKFMDDRYYRHFWSYLGPAPVIRPRVLERHLKAFNIHPLHSGESYDNILKIFYIVENYPDVALFVQTNPSYCCPALITEAMTRKIREKTGVPIVTLTYDGTSDRINSAIVPYIRRGAAIQEKKSAPQSDDRPLFLHI